MSRPTRSNRPWPLRSEIIEIAVEAEDGATFEIRATPEPLDVLTGDLETILDADDAGAA